MSAEPINDFIINVVMRTRGASFEFAPGRPSVLEHPNRPCFPWPEQGPTSVQHTPAAAASEPL